MLKEIEKKIDRSHFHIIKRKVRVSLSLSSLCSTFKAVGVDVRHRSCDHLDGLFLSADLLEDGLALGLPHEAGDLTDLAAANLVRLQVASLTRGIFDPL